MPHYIRDQILDGLAQLKLTWWIYFYTYISVLRWTTMLFLRLIFCCLSAFCILLSDLQFPSRISFQLDFLFHFSLECSLLEVFLLLFQVSSPALSPYTENVEAEFAVSLADKVDCHWGEIGMREKLLSTCNYSIMTDMYQQRSRANSTTKCLVAYGYCS